MIDKITLRFVTSLPDHILTICTEKRESTSGTTYYRNTKSKSLVVIFYPESNVVCVKGSLHRFLKTNNYSDFTRSEVKQAVKKLCFWLLVDPDDESIRITRIELGVNIVPEKPVKEYIRSLRAFKGVLFDRYAPPKGSVKQWGKFSQKCSYRLKIYDKRSLTELRTPKMYWPLIKDCRDNLLRFEVSYFRKPSLKYLDKLSSLYSRQFFIEGRNHLLNLYDCIIFAKDYEPSMSLNQSIHIYAFENPAFQELVVIDLDPKIRRAVIRQYNILVRKFAVKTDKSYILRGQIRNNLRYLIGN